MRRSALTGKVHNADDMCELRSDGKPVFGCIGELSDIADILAYHESGGEDAELSPLETSEGMVMGLEVSLVGRPVLVDGNRDCDTLLGPIWTSIASSQYEAVDVDQVQGSD